MIVRGSRTQSRHCPIQLPASKGSSASAFASGIMGRRAQKHGRFTSVNTGCFRNEDVSVNQQRALHGFAMDEYSTFFLDAIPHNHHQPPIINRSQKMGSFVWCVGHPSTPDRGTGQGNHHFLMPSLFNREVSQVSHGIPVSVRIIWDHLGIYISYFTNLKAIWGWFPENKPWFQGEGEQGSVEPWHLPRYMDRHPYKDGISLGHSTHSNLWELNELGRFRCRFMGCFGYWNHWIIYMDIYIYMEVS